jgi:hypothetical protein
MFRTVRVACGALLALASVTTAQAATLELVQPGDADMTCQALSAEMNTLSAAKAKAARRAESGRKLLGFASTALQIASSSGALGGRGGGLGAGNQSGYIAQQALGSIQAQAMQQQMAQGYGAGLGGFGPTGAAAPAAPAADTSIEAQRLARLTDLHAQKSC